MALGFQSKFFTFKPSHVQQETNKNMTYKKKQKTEHYTGLGGLKGP